MIHLAAGFNRDRGNKIRHSACVLLTCMTAAIALNTMAAQLSGAPTALSINNVTSGGLLGWSVAVSANGQVAAGGAPATNRSGTSGTDYTGAAYVYTQSNGTWSDPVTLSTTGIPTGGQLGNSIAVSPNGQQVFVGAPDLTTFTGAVFVYSQVNGSWSNAPTRTALTLPSGVTTYYSFGTALAVSSNGQTLVVGAGHLAAAGSSPGGLYVYTLSSGTWGNPVALPMGSIANGAEIGKNVAISGTGTTILAGDTKGDVYVWTNSGGTWSGPVALSVPASAGSSFGSAVALSDDGTVAVIGAPNANSPAGIAYVYTNASGSWSTTPTALSTSTPNTNAFGESVAISPDGQNAFLGASGGTNSTGAVFVSSHASSWSTPVALSVANLPPGAQIGMALAQGDYGEELVTSGAVANLNTGGLWVYTSPAAITLAGSPSATSIAPGSALTFNLTLTNSDQPGNTPATTLNNVVLTDTLPTGVTYKSSNAANGNCSNSGGTVTCTLASLAPGNNSQNPWTPSITVTTPSSAAVLTNSVSMSANEPLIGATTVSTKVTNDVTPTVTNGFLSTSPGQAVSGTLTAKPGFAGQQLSFAITTQPANGSVTLNAATGAFTYTPNAGFSGTDVFVFTAGDGIVTSGSGVESVTVSNPTGPPTATNGSVTTAENTAVNNVLSCASCTGALTFAIATQPAHGSVTLTDAASGAFTYTPTTGYSGSDSFTFKVSNSLGTSNAATESVTVTPEAPTANNGSLTTSENTAASGSLTASGGGTLSFTVVGQPAHGTVSLTNTTTGAFTYTPASGYSGADSFTFTTSNAGGTSNTATESITVNAASGGSSSSGKSGGGAMGVEALLLCGLLGLTKRRKKIRLR